MLESPGLLWRCNPLFRAHRVRVLQEAAPSQMVQAGTMRCRSSGRCTKGQEYLADSRFSGHVSAKSAANKGTTDAARRMGVSFPIGVSCVSANLPIIGCICEVMNHTVAPITPRHFEVWAGCTSWTNE